MISTFDWTNDAVQRIFRVPAGFMRSKTQERIEELARERAAASIDLALVEEGIEIGKQMMAEMIATYSPPAAITEREARTLQRGSSPLDRGRRLPQRGERTRVQLSSIASAARTTSRFSSTR